jgi:hypothetical protein
MAQGRLAEAGNRDPPSGATMRRVQSTTPQTLEPYRESPFVLIRGDGKNLKVKLIEKGDTLLRSAEDQGKKETFVFHLRGRELLHPPCEDKMLHVTPPAAERGPKTACRVFKAFFVVGAEGSSGRRVLKRFFVCQGNQESSGSDFAGHLTLSFRFRGSGEGAKCVCHTPDAYLWWQIWLILYPTDMVRPSGATPQSSPAGTVFQRYSPPLPLCLHGLNDRCSAVVDRVPTFARTATMINLLIGVLPRSRSEVQS